MFLIDRARHLHSHEDPQDIAERLAESLRDLEQRVNREAAVSMPARNTSVCRSDCLGRQNRM